jgi:hypothetical protein
MNMNLACAKWRLNAALFLAVMLAAIAAMLTACIAVKQPVQPVTMTPLSKREGPVNGSNQAQVKSELTSENPTNKMSMLFGNNTAFTATAVMQSSEGSAGETLLFGWAGARLLGALSPGIVGETHYAFLDGKLRMEIDMSGSLPKNVRRKSMGHLHTVSLMLPSASGAHYYVIYPDLHAYRETTRTSTTYNEANLPKTEQTEIGRETIDGHPCVKCKRVITLPDGKKYESTVWLAADLNDFPIKTTLGATLMRATFTMTFKDISLTRPPADLFEIPAGFKRYDNMQEMRMDSLEKK